MTAIEKYFFTPLYFPRSDWAVVGWWESRRPLFNFCVGGAGVLTVAVVSALSLLPPHPSAFRFPLAAILVYAVMANVFYTLGPAADLLLRRLLGPRAPAVGPVLFRYGFVFSMGLTLLPIPLVMVGWLLRFLQ